MARPDLTLHLGMDKTGTTALQYALHQAQGELAQRHGILVPRTGLWTDFSHHPFAFAALGIHGHSRSDLAGLFTELEAEIAHSGCGRVVMSSECLFRLPAHPGIAEFWAGLRASFASVRLVVYLRRQDLWAESRFRHAIISGAEETLDHLSSPAVADYLPALRAWEDLAGRDAMTVRPYDPARFAGGDIGTDFTIAAGLPPGCLPGLQGIRRNMGFSAEAVLLRSGFNQLGLAPAQLEGLNEALARVAPQGRAPQPFVSPQRAAQLASAYADPNAQIALRYGLGPLFTPPPPGPPAPFTAPALTPARLTALLTAIAAINPGIIASARAASAPRPLPGAVQPVGALIETLRQLRPPPRQFRQRLRALVFGPRADEILVHFGMVKTGSTAIQQALFAAREALGDVAYIHAGQASGSAMVSNAVQGLDTLLAGRAFGASREEAAAAQDLARSRLTAALTRGCASAPRLLLSAEVIGSFSASELDSLRAFLRPHAARLRFIGYLRDPVSLMLSVLQERIKHRLQAGFSIDALIAAGPAPRFAVVDRLDALFGRAAVSVYPYDPEGFPGGDVTAHFLKAAQVTGAAAIGGRANESLPQAAVKALYCYRKLLAPQETRALAASRQEFLAPLRGLGGPKLAFHPDLAQSLYARAQDRDRWATARLGAPLPRIQCSAPTGIAREADLMAFSAPEMHEIAGLAVRSGIRFHAAGAGPAEVAQLLHSLRQRAASAG